jgi:protein-tyrosine phosphatase
MRLTAQNKGIQLKNRARQFQSKDFDRFDLVLAMDRFNLSELRKLAPKSFSEDQLMLFRTFDPKSNGDLDVPDPYYGGERGFETVFQIVERTCPPLPKHIKSHLLNTL